MLHWILKMSSSGSNAFMETSVPLVNAIANKALFHSSPHINQMLLHDIHSLHLITLMQIYCWVIQWKNFDNRSTFDEVIGRAACFVCVYPAVVCQTVSVCVRAYTRLLDLSLPLSERLMSAAGRLHGWGGFSALYTCLMAVISRTQLRRCLS